MFDMDEYAAYLDRQNAALESVLADMDAEEAMEGLFSKPKSVPKLLASLNKLINKRCKSAADCDDLLAKLSAEEKQFNGALSAMKKAAEELQAGSIDKKEMKQRINAEVKKLKTTCDILNLKDINNKTDSITDEELQNLRDFLIGAKDAINKKKQEFGEIAKEGYDMSYLDDTFGVSDDIASESVTAIAAGFAIGAGLGMIINLAISCKHPDAVTLRGFRKRTKPLLKEIKARFKSAKKAHDYPGCVKALKEMEKMNERYYALVKKLTPLKESDAILKSSDGKTQTAKIKQYNAILKNANAIYQRDKEYIQKRIVMYTEKQKTSATEAAAFIAGFDAAMESMEDGDVNDLDLGLESDFDFDIEDVDDDDIGLESDFAALEAQMDDIAFDLAMENDLDLGLESDFDFDDLFS